MAMVQKTVVGSSAPPQRVARGSSGETWVLRIEHWFLRVVSLIFSFGSAYAISQVFSPPNPGDVVRQLVDIGIAAGFGVLGYFLSRSIAYRLMQKESVWAYVPICLVVELVEIFSNYVMGVSEVSHAAWLLAIPHAQQGIITDIAYIVLSIIPAVTLFLAVADMDLERRKTSTAKPKTPHPTGFSAPANQGRPAVGNTVVRPQPQGPVQASPVKGQQGPVQQGNPMLQGVK